MRLPAEFSSWNEQPYHSGQMPYDYDGARTSSYHGRDTRDNLLRDNGSHFYGNDIEEQMIQAAIEASKQEVEEGYLNKQFIFWIMYHCLFYFWPIPFYRV